MKKIDSYIEFRSRLASLKDVSFDDSNNTLEHMSKSEKKVIDFDQVKRNYTSNLHISENHICSVDAIFQDEEDRIFFVEFKNGDAIRPNNIRMKARDSLLMFNSVTKSQIDETRCFAEFILVVNDEKISNLSIKEKKAIHMARKANLDIDLYGLAGMRGYCFKRVNCMSASEFDKWVERHI